jgi:hypothetical protein
MVSLPDVQSSSYFLRRLRRLNEKLRALFAAVEPKSSSNYQGVDGSALLRDFAGVMRTALASVEEAEASLTRTEHVRYVGHIAAPRILVVAEDLLASLDYGYEDTEFTNYLRALQKNVVLRLDELRTIVPALQFVLLEQAAELAHFAFATNAISPRFAANGYPKKLETCIRSLREIDLAPWPDLLEPLIVFDEVLRRDPAAAYGQMDPQSREMYRKAVVTLAEHSDLTELDIAELALALARESQRASVYKPASEALAYRRAHIGYYLIAEGQEELRRRAHVRLPLREQWRSLVRRFPNGFYLGGIGTLTLGMMFGLLYGLDISSLGTAVFAALALLLPCSEASVQMMNYLTSSLLTPQVLPKLDFANGVPRDCATMVVVPTLLLNEKQIRQLVSDLEVRYLGNMSANLHFALLTDLPDSDKQPGEDDPLVEICGQLIRNLNHKYAGDGGGTFAMLHRHRVCIPDEGIWMGWERKRGKLLDFNRLILGQYDSFPYKVGDLSVLPHIRYVLTIDSDTELPRGAAQRLIGTLAHPLCTAVIDDRNVVTKGYGILQPRVSISIESAAQSRLASIFSGPSGFDIYTHATSDVYQDLYGEGTFVGKGIYDLRAVHRVLDHRFPRNSILSHDLIEGAYARTGLVSDVEVVDHYPSRYSSFTRRKHRWIRGDWQVMEWLFPRVPDESGHSVPNPIPLISRWKIMDNLRRSMMGPATLTLFILGWLVLPGRPLRWTAITLFVLFAPAWFQFAVSTARALLARSLTGIGDAFASLVTAVTGVLLLLAFLIHDALVSLDAAIRSLYRRTISGRRLLEWETAAEAELGGRKRTSLDTYLAWTPAIASAVSGVLLLLRPEAFWVALPILVLWASSREISVWLDRPPRRTHNPITAGDKTFLRVAALRTWRYFAEFSSCQHHWLVPDCVQEQPASIAARVSPTNIGFLLNARQIACELGYITVPELAEQTRLTLETMSQLQTYRGHLLNWYNTRTLSPEAPYFVSSVDSGNLAASLISLKVGCVALLDRPLLSPSLLEGYADYLRVLAEPNSTIEQEAFCTEQKNELSWLKRLITLASERVTQLSPELHEGEARWFATQTQIRKEQVHELLAGYMPWLLPEFESLRIGLGTNTGDDAGGASCPSLLQLPELIQQLQKTHLLDVAKVQVSPNEGRVRERLGAMLEGAYERAVTLTRDLRTVAAEAERWVADMDFSFLLEPRRKLLSVGYDLSTKTLDPACYDLLASEARIATFIAIGKCDVPQETWFRLGRAHVPVRGGSPTLVSWAGTMFEYLMPAIWMRSQSGTLLQNTMLGAVRAQKAYAAAKEIPWGISESGYSEQDDAGIYQYAAIGVPELALRGRSRERLVIAPYATAMALGIDPAAALSNLRRMADLGWLHTYGFYEAADFGVSDGPHAVDPSLVKEWMAHHQGMVLLSIGNLLQDNIMQQWFHGDARVRATELLLHERPVLQHVRPAWHFHLAVKFERTSSKRSLNELSLAS